MGTGATTTVSCSVSASRSSNEAASPPRIEASSAATAAGSSTWAGAPTIAWALPAAAMSTAPGTTARAGLGARVGVDDHDGVAGEDRGEVRAVVERRQAADRAIERGDELRLEDLVDGARVQAVEAGQVEGQQLPAVGAHVQLVAVAVEGHGGGAVHGPRRDRLARLQVVAGQRRAGRDPDAIAVARGRRMTGPAGGARWPRRGRARRGRWSPACRGPRTGRCRRPSRTWRGAGGSTRRCSARCRSASPGGTRRPSARGRPRRSASAPARRAGTCAGPSRRRPARSGATGRGGRGGRGPRARGVADRSGRMGVSSIRARNQRDRADVRPRRAVEPRRHEAPPAAWTRRAPPPWRRRLRGRDRAADLRHRPAHRSPPGPAPASSSQASGSRPCSSSASSVRRAAGRSWAKTHTNTAVLTSAISVTPNWDRIASPMPSQSRMLGLSG